MDEGLTEEEISREFARKLQFLLKTGGKTQKELAESLGVKQPFVSELTRRVKDPNLWHVVGTAIFFDVPVDWLIDPNAECKDAGSLTDARIVRRWLTEGGYTWTSRKLSGLTE